MASCFLDRVLWPGHAAVPGRLFTNATAVRLDFAESRGWVFEDAEPRYTIALLAADFAWCFRGGLGRGTRRPARGAQGRAPRRWTAEVEGLRLRCAARPEPSGCALRHCYVVAPRFDADVGDCGLRVAGAERDDAGRGGLLVEGGRGWPVYAGDSSTSGTAEPSALRVRLLRAQMEATRPLGTLAAGALSSDARGSRYLASHKARILFRDVTNRTNSRTVISRPRRQKS